jgi:simple sugar transport system permease protein
MTFGVLHAALTGPVGAPQPLAGIAVTLLAASLALAGAGLLAVAPQAGARIAGFAPVTPPASIELPAAVVTILQQTPLAYIAILLALIVAYVLNRTPLGLALRACGDNPAAVAAQGRSVNALRCGAIVAGSAMMAVGGAALALTAGKAFALDLAGGRGFICLALAAAAGWRPALALALVLPFGAIEAIGPHLSNVAGGRVAADVLRVAPYALAIAALAAAGRRAGLFGVIR